MIWIILLTTVIILIYKWGTNTFEYFRDRGIPHKKPMFLVGNNQHFITQKFSMPEFIMDQYYAFPNERFFGGFEFKTPSYWIRDPQLLKEIAVKNFDHFQDRNFFMDEEMDPLFGKAVFGLTGQKWRDMRATLSPAFTGTRMRIIFDLISQVGKQSTETLKKTIDKSGASYEMRDFLSKFTVDIIATSAFGIEVNSFENPKNDFQEVSKTILNPRSIMTIIKVIGYVLCPKLMKFFKIRLADKKVSDFFQATIIDVMNQREEKGIIRNDMIQLLIEARKGKLVHTKEEKTVDGFATVEESDVGKSKIQRNWTDEDLAAQAFIFFLAGFDTVTNEMAFASYELGANPEIQDRLIAEIDAINDSLNGKHLTYDHVQNMKYMDQFISEVLRKLPSVPMINRKCVKDFTLNYDGKSILIEEGVQIILPFYAYHHDPKYFPDPEKFDPERFSDENKKNIDSAAYLPFGIGPRNCIGSRLALLEIKVVLYYLLLNFRFEVCEKTQIPMKFSKSPFTFAGEKGIWFNLVPRA